MLQNHIFSEFFGAMQRSLYSISKHREKAHAAASILQAAEGDSLTVSASSGASPTFVAEGGARRKFARHIRLPTRLPGARTADTLVPTFRSLARDACRAFQNWHKGGGDWRNEICSLVYSY